MNEDFYVVLNCGQPSLNPILLWVYRENNCWKYLIYGYATSNSLNLCEIYSFDIIGLDGYWFYKNDSLWVCTSNSSKRYMDAKEYFSYQYNLDSYDYAVTATLIRHNLISKDEYESINDSLWKAQCRRQVVQDSIDGIKKSPR